MLRRTLSGSLAVALFIPLVIPPSFTLITSRISEQYILRVATLLVNPFCTRTTSFAFELQRTQVILGICH